MSRFFGSNKFIIISAFFGLVFLAHTEKIFADCSCSVGSNGTNVIGYEFQAISCPTETGSYTYRQYFIDCIGNRIHEMMFWTTVSGTPETVIQRYTGSNDRILRNPDGTHLIAVAQVTSAPVFNGVIAGVVIDGKPAGSYYPDPPEKLNQYCMSFSSPPDTDGDGFPDCLDCDINDPQNICTNCDAEYQDKITECRGEENIWKWNSEICTGECIQYANLGSCQE